MSIGEAAISGASDAAVLRARFDSLKGMNRRDRMRNRMTAPGFALRWSPELPVG